MQRLNPKEFQYEIPTLNPLSNDYIEYWKEQKRRCIEGHWVDGHYMPAKLYFYSNFGIVQKQEKYAKGKSYARPNLRDIEWIALRGLTAARGFSGFRHSPYTSLEVVRDVIEITPEFVEYLEIEHPEALTIDEYGITVPKPYLHPVDHLQAKLDVPEELRSTNHAAFKNNAKNIILCGSREYGKATSDDANILTDKGWIKWKDLTYEHKLFGRDGKLKTITFIHPKEYLDLYEIVLEDGRKTIASKEHEWTVLNGISEEIVETQALIVGVHAIPEVLSFNKNLTKVKEVNYYGNGWGNCVTVEDDHYLIDDFILTHNSFMLGVGTVLHEYLFDGTDAGSNKTKGFSIYDKQLNEGAKSTMVVGASQSKYSNAVLSKTKDGLDFLPGKVTFLNKTYPSPFYKGHKGSFKLGDKIEQTIKKKIGGTWQEVGSRSTLYHVSYESNPFAAQGLRSNLMLFEEAGHFDNLEETFLNCIDNMKSGDEKFGTAVFIGTGGAIDGGGLALQEMFYNPQKYDLLEYEDTWEYRGKIGGIFIPVEMRHSNFKDEWGYTNWEKAKNYEQAERNKKSSTKGSSLALAKYIQYNPSLPSEMFLTKGSNVFPSIELQRRLKEVEQNDLYHKTAKKVELYFDPKGEYNGISYRLDITNKLTDINEFPLNTDKVADLEGAVVIYEFPQKVTDRNQGLDDQIPHDAYIIGHDPYASDSNTGESLATIFVLKTKKYFNHIGHDEIVAVYRGRPYMGREVVNETLLKLSLMYGNAKIYFENAVGNVKEYFEKTKKLHLLAKQPRTVLTKKASYNIHDPVIYGYPMSNQVIKQMTINYLRDWLLEEHSSKTDSNGDVIQITRNLDLITDRRLLQQLIAFNFDLNADDVMGFAGCIIGLNETQNQYKEKFFPTEEDQTQKEIASFLGNNKSLFQNTRASNTPSAFKLF